MQHGHSTTRALIAVVFATLLVTTMLQQVGATPLVDPCSSGDCTLVGIFPGNDKSSGPDKSAHVDAATGVDVSLVMVGAADGANGTMNFNGYGNGNLTVIVPLGWRVLVQFENKGLGALPHSLTVINEINPLPIEDGAPATARSSQSRHRRVSRR